MGLTGEAGRGGRGRQTYRVQVKGERGREAGERGRKGKEGAVRGRGSDRGRYKNRVEELEARVVEGAEIQGQGGRGRRGEMQDRYNCMGETGGRNTGRAEVKGGRG